MKLSILGWHSEGLRCPDVDVSFSEPGSHSPYAVTLLQMPNGTGKTTTLELIRASLDGSAERWSADTVRSFRRARSDSSCGRFCLRLAVDDEPLTFTLDLDFDAGLARYTTQFRSRNVVHHDPPAHAARFLRSEFVQLFIFDGEYASELFDNRQSEARKAITNLFQLYLFEDLEEACEVYLKEQIRAIGSQSRSSSAIKDMSHKLETAQKKVRELRRIEHQAKEALQQDKARVERLDAKLEAVASRTKRLHDKRARALAELGKSEQTAADSLNSLLGTLRRPLSVHQRFHDGLRDLVDGLERLRLPANTAAQWFDELAAPENSSCICGRPLGDEERTIILAMKDRYLGAAVHSVLNAIKGCASQALHEHAQSNSSANEQIMRAIAAAKQCERHKRECETQLHAAERELAEHGTAEEQSIAQEAMGLRPRIADYENLLRELSLPSGPRSIKEAEDQLRSLQADLAKATKTVELNEKIRVLRGILSNASELADAALRKDVLEKCNERLERVLRNDPLRIKSIESSLTLESQGGASMGQTLAVGYTFLVTLLNEGKQSFPLVVDSPAGPLDHSIRREVARIIPAMSDQFLAFTISTEREGFVTTLADTVEKVRGEQVQFLTLVRLTPGTQPLLANAPDAGTTMTANSALIEDRGFFEAFNLDEQGDEA